MSRKYLPTLSELVDRLSIAQLKEVFIPEHKEEYAKEIKDIMHDINLEGVDAELIRSVIVLSQMNLHIWHNESNYRKGIKDGNNLELTHGLNGIRNIAKNKIQGCKIKWYSKAIPQIQPTKGLHPPLNKLPLAASALFISS